MFASQQHEHQYSPTSTRTSTDAPRLPGQTTSENNLMFTAIPEHHSTFLLLTAIVAAADSNHEPPRPWTLLRASLVPLGPFFSTFSLFSWRPIWRWKSCSIPRLLVGVSFFLFFVCRAARVNRMSIVCLDLNKKSSSDSPTVFIFDLHQPS